MTNKKHAPAQATIRIDGDKVRKIREAKGLTQLYLATVVGVTTDTISRWEHRKYPAIKKENAIKLAEALGVPLEEILELENMAAIEKKAPTAPTRATPPQETTPKVSFFSKKYALLFLSLSLAAAIIIVFFYLQTKVHELKIAISADRIIPPHAAPGHTFPVFIIVRTVPSESIPVIIRERVPDGTKILRAFPPPVSQQDNEIKWISETDKDPKVFMYAMEINPQTSFEKDLRFEGWIKTAKDRLKGNEFAIKGFDKMDIKYLHWADTNGNQKIDDEEILTFYDTLGEIKEFVFDRKEVEDIWAGSGYYYDQQKKKFIAIP